MTVVRRFLAPVLCRAARVSESAARHLVAASDRAADRHEEWMRRLRRRVLRLGWVFDVLLGVAVAATLLALWQHLPAGMIHSLAGLGLLCLALRIWHAAEVIKGKKRGEI